MTRTALLRPPCVSGEFGETLSHATTTTRPVERLKRPRGGVLFVLPYCEVSKSESSPYVCDFLSYIRFLTRRCITRQGAVVAVVPVVTIARLDLRRSIFAVVTVVPVVTTPLRVYGDNGVYGVFVLRVTLTLADHLRILR